MKALLTPKTLYRFFCVILLALSTASCGFHLRSNYMIPTSIAHLSLTSFDPYGMLTRDVQAQFKMHGIKEVPVSKDVPNLNLDSESTNQRTLSLYQDGGAAQYELTYTANYTVVIPNVASQNFTATVRRNFLDNPLTALAKSIEEDVIKNEMRQEAAQQIMRQLARLTAIEQEASQKKLQQEVVHMMENSPNNRSEQPQSSATNHQ